MDRKIESPKGKKKLRRIAVFVVVFSALLMAVYLLTSVGGKYKVEGERLQFAEVFAGTFDDVIGIQGSVEPVQSFYLDAVEGGTVQEKYVEAGMMVEKDQPLLKLSNTNLMLDFMNRETQIVEQINNLRNTRMQMELNERTIKEQLLDIAFEKQKTKRQYTIDTSLYASRVIAIQEYEDSHDRYKYLREKQELLQQSFAKNEAYQNQQIQQIDLSIEMMERNLEAIRKNLENLTVKAAIAGQLTSFSAEIGESKVKGENLGRIDMLDDYIVRAQVDEHYLNRVKEGQQARFSQGGKTYWLSVNKVFPEVTNNQFAVEFSFTDTIPANARRGQTVGLRLALSNSVEAILVPRGSFYGSSGGKWVYVVNEDGTEAEKREVVLGRQNPDFIEVKEGLRPGDKIISSSYSTYENYQSIIIIP